MTKRLAFKLVIAAAAAGAAATAVSFGVASGSNPTPPPTQAQQQSVAAGILSQVLPKATAQLITDPSGTGYQLVINEPVSDIAEPGSDTSAFAAPPASRDQGQYAAAETGWKANLAAALAATRAPDVMSFSVRPIGGSVSSPANNFLHSVLRFAPGAVRGPSFSRLGTVSLSQLTAQLQSNLTVLTGVLPAGTVEASRIVAVPVDAASNLYGLEIDLKVNALSQLGNNLGDVFEGLATGLVGTPAATLEGLAINIVDSSGLRAGTWTVVRDGSGAGALDTSLSWPQKLTATTSFPNLTGGPPTIGSIQGSAGVILAEDVVTPDRSIGPVALGDQRNSVRHKLGEGQGVAGQPNFRRYRFGSVILQVAFDREHRVSAVSTSSGSARLDGRPLSRGFSIFQRILRDWIPEKCSGINILQHQSGRHFFASTTIEWGKRFVGVEISDRRAGVCGVSSPAMPAANRGPSPGHRT